MDPKDWNPTPKLREENFAKDEKTHESYILKLSGTANNFLYTRKNRELELCYASFFHSFLIVMKHEQNFFLIRWNDRDWTSCDTQETSP